MIHKSAGELLYWVHFIRLRSSGGAEPWAESVLSPATTWHRCFVFQGSFVLWCVRAIFACFLDSLMEVERDMLKDLLIAVAELQHSRLGHPDGMIVAHGQVTGGMHCVMGSYHSSCSAFVSGAPQFL